MKRLVLSCLMLLTAQAFYAQVTTSSITGYVYDNASEPLIGATVVATHLPSGSEYGTITNESGKYTIVNMRVGGPYEVVVSYIGYSTSTTNDIFLRLGEKFNHSPTLQSEDKVLDEIVVMASGAGVVDKDKTGASTTISRDQINNLPTISRSASDYTRLNPMAAEGGSFAGRNDQFNNYSVNGTIFNNPFGLDAATPGGQTDAQPISLDAIDQIQVSIAPFDVTQSGFTGASVNAVTKSGNNNFEGTVYGFFRNSDMLGSKVDDTEVSTGDLNQSQYGFAVGGPIVKDKVFFFANLEIENRSDLGSYFVPSTGTSGSNVSRVLASDMELVSNLLMERYGYDTGEISNFKHDADNTKGLIRLDFNLHTNHKLSATYNFLDAFKDKPAHPSAIGRRGPDFLTLQFQNSGYRINNKIQSGIVELKSVFGTKISNKFQAGLTAFEDSRDPFSSPFPVLNIGKNGIRYIVAGHEPFSINNRLDQNVIQIQDNLNIYLGDHNLTIGTSFEKFSFDNSFNLTGYGARVFFPDIDINEFEDFIDSGALDEEVAAAKAAFDNNNANDSWALAETNLGQWSGYIQDEYTVNPNLTITAGLRIDMPLYFDTKEKIEENIARNGGLVSDGGVYAPDVTYYDENGAAVQFDHTELPKQQPLINPRLGFNYSSGGSLQVRGGTGLFSGRFPFVWVGNQVANPAFFFYCMTDPNFKFPQVWKNNLGIDKQLDNGWSVSLDVVYTKDLQAQMVRNYGLISPGGTLQGVDNRPIYRDNDRAQGPFGGATNAYVFGNTNLGYSFNTSLQVQKSWEDMSLMIGYNFLDAKDAASIDAEISSDAYDRNPANINNTNVAELAPSLYGNKNRILGAFTKKFDFGGSGRFGTTVSIFTEYVQGGRYSYTYSGDINNDGSSLNDLIYIPTDGEIDQMSFAGADAAAQRQALRTYIAQDEYLSGRRGQYAEKYASLSPWYNHWDLRILQDVGVSEGNKFQISIDVLNFGNLINSAWGVRQFASSTGLAQPIGVTVTDGVPVYSFDANQTSTFFNDFGLSSRWQLQLGLRYIFK